MEGARYADIEADRRQYPKTRLEQRKRLHRCGRGGKPSSPSSQTRNEQVFRLYLKPKLGAKGLSEITTAMVDDLKADTAATPIQFNRTLAAVTTCLNWAINKEDENQVPYKRDPRNPCNGVKQYPPTNVFRALTKEERTRYIETCHSWITDPTRTFEDKVMAYWALTAHFCAPRLRELLHAKWEWVSWNRRVIELPDSKTAPGTVSTMPVIGFCPKLRLKTTAVTMYAIPGQRSSSKKWD